uniref:Gamma-glutamylcyclotransferase n=1 Tax=Mandrillus leucophaeus TaxID=9568 RepID=A0A2K5XUA8_MANLE
MANSGCRDDSFLYFVYGSNLIHLRNPSAAFFCVARLGKHKLFRT